MNILFIVTELNSANGICTQSVMQEFAENGHSVYCITNDEPHSELLSKVTYVYVKPRFTYRLLTSGKKIRHSIGLILNKIKLMLAYPTWPLVSPIYTGRIYRKAEKIVREKGIEVIVPIYTQIDALIAAEKIKKQHPEVQYIPYFLDSLSGGYGPKCFSRNWLVRRGMKWEDRLLKAADKIIMMKSSMEHYSTHSSMKDYYQRIAFLDLPLIRRPRYESDAENSDGLVHLVFIGSIPFHIRNPEPFLRLFNKMDNKDYRLHIFGTSNCNDMLREYAQKDQRIILEGPIPHDTAMQRMAESDIMVNFGNNNSAMTPSKIFEYMSHGKPIISTLPISDEPSAVYLKKYPLAYLVDYANADTDSAAKELQTWIDSAVGNTVPFASVEEIFKCNTPEIFVDMVAQGRVG